ncbi:hypothetical protein DRP05_00805 [Archaeoglobales archaeon]|nr:MAG: hypothetical protein DRP05_00805 [Archaeoglobales archaeon]
MEWCDEDIIDVYTRQDAIEDGVIFKAGRIANRDVDLTTNLIAKLDKYELAKAIVEGLETARHFRQPGMKEIVVNGKRVWVDDNGSVITLMLPEDY